MPSVKALFLTNGILGQIGDRMWFFAAYLLLAKAFPGHRLILGKVNLRNNHSSFPSIKYLSRVKIEK